MRNPYHGKMPAGKLPATKAWALRKVIKYCERGRGEGDSATGLLWRKEASPRCAGSFIIRTRRVILTLQFSGHEFSRE